MSERGFITGVALYAAIGAVAVMGAMGIALKIKSSQLDACRAEYTAFRTETKRLGEAQDKANREKESRDRKEKETTDARHKATVAGLNRELERVRDLHARSSLTPQASATTRRPDLACFDRAEFARALSVFEGEVEAIVGEGAARAIELDLAKEWAQRVVAEGKVSPVDP